MRNINNLYFLHECLTLGIKPPETLERWLTDALSRWKAGEPLADALGIYDSVVERRFRRDQALCEYARLLNGTVGSNARQIAEGVTKIHQGRKFISPMLRAIDSIHPLCQTALKTFHLSVSVFFI